MKSAPTIVLGFCKLWYREGKAIAEAEAKTGAVPRSPAKGLPFCVIETRLLKPKEEAWKPAQLWPIKPVPP